uniref:Odorant receptor n=1 Tax=Lobesia botrana TaxID=209534 RepID=A0A345BET9_9NEOP|nr:odorant receptors OR4.1 [Lobesia botrana]
MSINKFLNSLEDPNNPILGPTIAGLKFSGLLLPESKTRKNVYIFLHMSCFLLAATEYIDIWFVKNDTMLLMANLKVSMLATISVFKVSTFLIWQKRWIKILSYVSKTNLEQIKSTDLINHQILAKMTKYCRKVTYIYWSLTYFTAISIILQPIMKYVLSSTYRENLRTGEENYLQVISSYVPFDKTTLPGYIAAFFYQSTETLFAAAWIASFDSNAIVIMTFFHLEIELLKRDSSKIFGSPNSYVGRQELEKRIKNCHARHVNMMRHAKLFNSCLSPIMLLYMLVCSIMLCVTTYQMSVENSFIQKCMTAEFLVFGVSQLFLYCWHSNSVFYASQELHQGPYESAWWRNTSHRKDVLILIMQFRKIVVFSAGPFSDLTLPTFISILKGAYSYYTILSQSNEYSNQ